MSVGVSNTLKALPKSLKKKKKKLIVERNGECGLLCTQHAADTTAFSDDASDDKSTITVSDDEDLLSPASNLHKAIMASSPKTGKILLSQGPKQKTSRQGHDTAQPESVFHHCLHELYNNNIYMPLSMFTMPSLAHINANAVTMDTRKVNGESGEKPFHVLNTVIFEKDVLKETEMDCVQWTEAALNFVAVAEGVVEGAESDIVKRWQAHFGHFSNASNKQRNYPALLTADITLHQHYISLPFVYNCTLYNDETWNGMTVIEVDKHVKELMTSSVAAPAPVYAGGSSGGGGARGGAPPFQGSNDGVSPAIVCLVCTRRGHLFKECTATTFSDSTALRSTITGGNILALGSGETLCRMWNTCGAAAACNHTPLRTHVCTFCNSKNHHVFSWTCRQNPLA
ncbi:hypothetical protein DFH07DRAFT_776328 [Mycena maculata]|uniref:Uncharacterized protein n=1 Tax=Mycena maculata TaxID=230809 RepID=A0AAD7N6S7_9AGAR|nr:hypothetical protein DFH07DRAFT_776328 [Mycena maculata]